MPGSFYKYAYLVIVTVVVIAVLEGMTRWLHLTPPLNKQGINYISDPFVPYRPRPFSRAVGRSLTNEFDFDYQYNSMGFRDVEHGFEKPSGVFRILGLGDSFTEGAGVDFRSTYLYRLEEMLNSRGGNHPRVEIIKAGIGGYGAKPERLLLQYYGVKYHPDLILVGLLTNDIWDAFTDLDDKASDDGFLLTYEARQLGSVGKWLYLHSYFCRTFLARYVGYKIHQKLNITWDEIWGPSEKRDKAWKMIESEYSKMSAIARKMNSEIAFIFIPQEPDPVNGYGGKGYRAFPSNELEAWCRRNSRPFIDVMPAMRVALATGPLFYKKDGHCNAAGYRVIAESLYSELTKDHLVP